MSGVGARKRAYIRRFSNVYVNVYSPVQWLTSTGTSLPISDVRRVVWGQTAGGLDIPENGDTYHTDRRLFRFDELLAPIVESSRVHSDGGGNSINRRN